MRVLLGNINYNNNNNSNNNNNNNNNTNNNNDNNNNNDDDDDDDDDDNSNNNIWRAYIFRFKKSSIRAIRHFFGQKGHGPPSRNMPVRFVSSTYKIQIPCRRGFTGIDSRYYGLSLLRALNDVLRVSATRKLDCQWHTLSSLYISVFLYACCEISFLLRGIFSNFMKSRARFGVALVCCREKAKTRSDNQLFWDKWPQIKVDKFILNQNELLLAYLKLKIQDKLKTGQSAVWPIEEVGKKCSSSRQDVV